MSVVLDEVLEPEVIVEPATIEAQLETPPAPVIVPESIYTYQPTDDEGRPIGGKQVIKYRTTDELTGKLAEQNTLLVRKLRAETRKNRLGITDPEEIPAEAPRFSEPADFNPRDLTNEERYELSRDLLDPSKALEAQAKLFEAAVGVSPETLRTTLRDVQLSNMQIRASQQAEAFVADNPDYVRCAENYAAITGWMQRYGLALVKENFQKAYDTLRQQDPPIIISGSRRADPEPAALPTPVTPVVVAPEPPARANVPTGLSRVDSSSIGTSKSLADEVTYKLLIDGQEKVFKGLAAINAMPGDEYKRRLLGDPSFGKLVLKLEEDALRSRRRSE